jgi:hypothetical protein
MLPPLFGNISTMITYYPKKGEGDKNKKPPLR